MGSIKNNYPLGSPESPFIRAKVLDYICESQLLYSRNPPLNNAPDGRSAALYKDAQEHVKEAFHDGYYAEILSVSGRM